MPGTKITKKQVSIYMQNRKDGKAQVVSAAKADISERSGRTIDNNEHWSQKDKKRTWKTRKDPFEEVWEKDVVPMLKSGVDQATFLLEELQEKYNDKFFDSMIRTLQRRIERWKALFGPDKEVMIRQIHEPGELGISDFTHPKDIKVTINGKELGNKSFSIRLNPFFS